MRKRKYMADPRVIDSWALVAWVRDEAVASSVEAYLVQAAAGNSVLFMSMVNVAETFYILAKRNSMAMAEQFLRRMASLPIRVVTPDEDAIMAAARIKAAHAVAFGDAFAMALAKSEGASVITGDEEIQRCGLVRVDWVGTNSKSKRKI